MDTPNPANWIDSRWFCVYEAATGKTKESADKHYVHYEKDFECFIARPLGQQIVLNLWHTNWHVDTIIAKYRTW